MKSNFSQQLSLPEKISAVESIRMIAHYKIALNFSISTLAFYIKNLVFKCPGGLQQF
jgi:hypothetical protein